jgi:hypothetical protein
MTPAEREHAVVYLEETREEYGRIAKSLSQAQFHHKPAADEWSVAEALEHIIIVESRVTDRLEKLVQQPPSGAKSTMEDETLIRTAAVRTTKIKGPEIAMPTGRWPYDSLLEEFHTVRGRTLDFARGTKADLRRYTSPHPVFGDLDSYQWLLLIPAHCQRHLAQAREVMGSPDFPRAAAAS